MRLTSEQAKALKAGELWEGVCTELDERIESVKNSLTICAPEKVNRLQEKVKALQALKTLPQDVIDRES